MSYWTFSDVFEEQGVIKQPFYGGYGLIAEGGVPKPAFNAFKLLHELGSRRIEVNSASALVTRRDNDSLAIAVWNLALPEEQGLSREITIEIKGAKNRRRAAISRVDSAHGSALAAYEAMGRPTYPSREQFNLLRQAAALSAPESRPIDGGRITLTVPPHGLVLLQIP
jgi:xylan 1,4-beta-xylosidase